MPNKVVIAVENSTNSKTGKVSVTYAPIQSCPTTCPFINGGCYAQHGHCGIHLAKMNRAAKEQKKTRPIDIALIESQEIEKLSGDKPLRLHIVGDCRTPKTAEILAYAAKEYTKKHGQGVWTYTHAWKTIPREKWGCISVLASCESIEDAKLAMKRGYAASAVRSKQFNNTFSFEGVKMVPCPEMIRGIPCEKCGICLKDDILLKNKNIVCFFPHGSGANKARAALFNDIPLSDGLAARDMTKKSMLDGSFYDT